jgi:hypothetical protein
VRTARSAGVARTRLCTPWVPHCATRRIAAYARVGRLLGDDEASMSLRTSSATCGAAWPVYLPAGAPFTARAQRVQCRMPCAALCQSTQSSVHCECTRIRDATNLFCARHLPLHLPPTPFGSHALRSRVPPGGSTCACGRGGLVLDACFVHATMTRRHGVARSDF